MPRELERAVVELVVGILDARIPPTPGWLVRPGRIECGAKWPLVRAIYSDLTELQLPDVMRSIERRQVDAVLEVEGQPLRILEVDERQHFNEIPRSDAPPLRRPRPTRLRPRCVDRAK